MIKFNNLKQVTPYILFKEKYDAAYNSSQKNIEAIAVASYDKQKNEVDSRFVNLKSIEKEKFIFFSNYNSPKSIAFESHNQITALIFWPSINVQIRLKAKIHRTSLEYNQKYFEQRSFDKNVLAISSNQSSPAKSHKEILEKYEKKKKIKDLSQCPEYWGGFSFTPYYFEFWEGNEFRINKRVVFEKVYEDWNQFILEP